jgi:F0F1-type ATP synthase beta subunit
MPQYQGTIVKLIGPVVDVHFADYMPPIYSCPHLSRPRSQLNA